MTVKIQSPISEGEISFASHLGQDSLNSRTTLSHCLQIIASVSAFHPVRLTPNRNKTFLKKVLDTNSRVVVSFQP